MPARFIKTKLGIGNFEPQILGLRHRRVDKSAGRSSSFETRLIFQRVELSVCGESESCGPNIIRLGHHQRSSASCAIALCSSAPRLKVSMISKPWRWWKLSLLADADHRPRVGAVGAAAERGDLVDDRGAVDEPADRPASAQVQGRIIEDRGIFRRAGPANCSVSSSRAMPSARPRRRGRAHARPHPAPWRGGSPCA